MKKKDPQKLWSALSHVLQGDADLSRQVLIYWEGRVYLRHPHFFLDLDSWALDDEHLGVVSKFGEGGYDIRVLHPAAKIEEKRGELTVHLLAEKYGYLGPARVTALRAEENDTEDMDVPTLVALATERLGAIQAVSIEEYFTSGLVAVNNTSYLLPEEHLWAELDKKYARLLHALGPIQQGLAHYPVVNEEGVQLPIFYAEGELGRGWVACRRPFDPPHSPNRRKGTDLNLRFRGTSTLRYPLVPGGIVINRKFVNQEKGGTTITFRGTSWSLPCLS